MDLCKHARATLAGRSWASLARMDGKIRWIIREKMKEILSTNDITLLQNVSESRIRQIWCHYRNTMTVPILAKPGRPSRSITNEEISAVIGTYKEYPCSAEGANYTAAENNTQFQHKRLSSKPLQQ